MEVVDLAANLMSKSLKMLKKEHEDTQMGHSQLVHDSCTTEVEHAVASR